MSDDYSELFAAAEKYVGEVRASEMRVESRGVTEQAVRPLREILIRCACAAATDGPVGQAEDGRILWLQELSGEDVWKGLTDGQRYALARAMASTYLGTSQLEQIYRAAAGALAVESEDLRQENQRLTARLASIRSMA